MTNTRIGDVELIEKKFPLMITEFSIRKDSGGKGKYRGGNGVIREIEMREDGLDVSILSERRSIRPNGLSGGGKGQMGKNLLLIKTNDEGKKSNYLIRNFGSKNSVTLKRGDRVRILTPGGGAFGGTVSKL